MSAVLKRAKRFYCKAMAIEFVAFLGIGLILGISLSFQHTFSFLLGGLTSFLPQCLFIYWVFFRKNAQAIKAFYRGEGLKWLATIVLMIVVLKMVTTLNISLFFLGYFLCLLCNGVFPIWINRQT